MARDIPEWVTDEIQNAKFDKPQSIARTGYILDIYEQDNKIDAQLYEPVEDGRYIITLDLSKKLSHQIFRKELFTNLVLMFSRHH